MDALKRSNLGMELPFKCSFQPSDPPVIDPFSFPLKKVGDRLSVSCVMSSGDLPMTLTWFKDDDLIPPELGVNVHVGWEGNGGGLRRVNVD